MRIITINLSEKYLDAIKVLTDLGVYPSRSEAVRSALEDFLKDELQFYENLDTDSFQTTIEAKL
jgi:Arc/MetJ-type ribon-helix-helix transcriptional regulator